MFAVLRNSKLKVTRGALCDIQDLTPKVVRLIVDVRGVNMATIPLYLSMDISNLRSFDIANFIRGSRLITNYDLASTFHSLPVRPSSRPLLGLKFLRNEGALRSNVAIMGLRDSPSFFTRSLEATQRAETKAVLLSFFDDLLVSGAKPEEAPRPPEQPCLGITTTVETICPICHVINCKGNCKCPQCSANRCKGHHPEPPIDYEAVKATGIKFNAIGPDDRSLFQDLFQKYDPLWLLPHKEIVEVYYQFPLEKGLLLDGIFEFEIPNPDINNDGEIMEEDLRDHFRNIFLALYTVQKHGSKISLKKSNICARRLKFFGMEFEGQKAYIPQTRKLYFEKMRDITTVNQFYSFLGSLLFIAEFIPNQAHFARVLYGYLNRPRSAKLPELHRSVCQHLIDVVNKAPPLTFPHPTQRLYLVTDASLYAVGCTFGFMDEKGQLVVSGYFSTQLPSQGLTIVEKEIFVASRFVISHLPLLRRPVPTVT